MKINIKATGLTLTDEIRSYLDKCLEKVEKHLHESEDAVANVELERHVSHDAGEVFRGELTLSGAGHSMRAESEGGTLHEAIDVLENHAIGELRKVKGKKINLFRREGLRVKNWLKFGRRQ